MDLIESDLREPNQTEDRQVNWNNAVATVPDNSVVDPVNSVVDPDNSVVDPDNSAVTAYITSIMMRGE